MTTFYTRNQDPAENDTHVRIDSLISFGVDVNSGSIDLAQTVVSFEYAGELKTVYSGSAFQSDFQGASSTAAVSGSGRDFTVHPESSFSGDEDIYVDIQTKNTLGADYHYRYLFRTHRLTAAITPITPFAGEKLVTNTTKVIVDFLEEPILITAKLGSGAITTVYDGAFQNSWAGEYRSGSYDARIYLTPPSDFTLQETVTISIETASDELDYLFYVDSRQITTSDDAWSPRITDAGPKKWEGHVKGVLSGSVYLQRISPDTGEQEVAYAEIFDHGYDADLDKYILLYVHSGNVYYSLADPADTPSRLVDPALQSETGEWAPRLTNNRRQKKTGTGINSGIISNTFLPLKSTASETVQAGGLGYSINFGISKFTALPSTHVRTVPEDSPLQIEITKMSETPEADMLAGFELYKVTEGTPNLIATLYLEEGEDSVLFNDYALPAVLDGIELVKTFYYVIPLYDLDGRIFRGSQSAKADIPKFSSVATQRNLGSGIYDEITSNVFLPLKKTIIDYNYVEKITGAFDGSLLISGVQQIG